MPGLTVTPMTRSGAALVAALMLPVLMPTMVLRGAAAAVPPPAHAVVVSGAGVASYPAFDPAITRYGVTTTAATDGTVTISATTDDPAGVVYVDGRPETDGEATVTGLVEGDEIAVWIDDAAGRARFSYVYLPAGFPTLEQVVADPGATAPGAVLLGLSNSWLRGYPGQDPGVPDYVETAVDRHGVPLHVESLLALPRSLDLKRQPNGHYTSARTTTTPGRTGEAVVELDEQFREVARHETVGLVNTDGHDSLLLPDGTVWLMAYEWNGDGTALDSVIQRIDPDGSVGFEWNSEPFADETVVHGPDYAHLNSFELMADGSLLASLRNLSAVFKIDTSTPGGSVVWKLGGRDSDFAITGLDGEPDGGPCAQHSAHELPDGDIVLFDNGSSDVFERLCLRADDPHGPAVQRPQSRVITLDLDAVAGTAEIIAEHAPEGRFALFAGSTQPLPAEHLLIGWASSTDAIATELDDAGEPVWELRDAAADPRQRYFSYRAQVADVPDVTAPTVVVTAPATGAVYTEGEAVVLDYRCTDRGGSSLQTCSGPAAPGGSLDTSTIGRHTARITATDAAGNTTTVTRAYVVRPAYRPDALVRAAAQSRYVGGNVYGASRSQRATAVLRRAGGRARFVVRLQNDGTRPDRLSYAVKGRAAGFRVTSAHLGGGRTPVLQPGQSWTFSLRVTRRASARPGDRVVVRVPVRSTHQGSARDAISAKVTARR